MPTCEPLTRPAARPWRAWWLLLWVLLGGSSGCATNPVSGQSDFVMMSEAEEVAIGRQYHPRILKEYGYYDNEALQEYVQQVGGKVAAMSHRPGLVYRFTVVDSPTINAFALPGGYIYITRGLLAYLDSEAELAAVLGHEIGHVTARHAVRQQSAAQAAGIGYTVAQILLPELRSSAAQDMFNILAQATLSGYGREQELESDRLGAEYLARSGYPPQAMLDVLRVLKAQEEYGRQLAQAEGRDPGSVGGYHGLFASHPDNDTRLKEVVNEALPLYVDRPAADRGVESFLKQIDGLVYGDSPEQGVRRQNRFYHARMGIAVEFPTGWEVQNLADRVVAVAPSGEATQVMTVQDLNRAMPPEQFIAERLRLQLSDVQPLAVEPLQGVTGRTVVSTRQGKRPARVSVIYKGPQAFILLGTSRELADFELYDGKLQQSAASFHALTPDERALAQALRIRLIRADDGTRYATLAQQSILPGLKEAQLRLLNQHYPAGEPRTGQMLKVVK
ncbi:MAG TPA: M48 family metalloprotease [Pseudomonadales bacterium]|jgi:predicted Zn-dependent protease|nr:M48 family metalloprotease [Pseudomonadales bacterium]